jgi:DNA/RNA endonuclease YhcR with UshA esterase domain
MLMKKLAPLALAFGLLAGCATARPNVAELKFNPGRYHDRSVTVDGVVTSSWGVPLVPFKMYKVDDGTGEVTVVSQDGRAPTKGARVSVKGRVSEFASFGGQSLGLHLRQENLKFRGY